MYKTVHWVLLLIAQHRKHLIAWKCSQIMLLLLLSHFSCVRLCATPETAAHQAPPSLGFSRQEHWSGLPLPSPKQESEKWKWSRSVVSDSSRPRGLQPTGLLCALECERLRVIRPKWEDTNPTAVHFFIWHFFLDIIQRHRLISLIFKKNCCIIYFTVAFRLLQWT